MIQAGTMRDTDVLLALYRWYVEASDTELADLNVTRADVLDLARHIDGGQSEYRQTELVTIGRNILMAYRAGQMIGPRHKL